MNTTSKHFFTGVLAIAALSFAACGDDEDTTLTGDTTNDTADISDTTGGDTTPDVDHDGMDHDTMEDMEEDTTPAVDLCLGEADMAIIAEGEVTGAAGDCGLSCLSDADPEACAAACVVEATGIGESCAGCYAATVKCAIDNCLAECVADPAADACVACRGENCDPAFYTCSGLEPSEGSGEGSGQ